MSTPKSVAEPPRRNAELERQLIDALSGSPFGQPCHAFDELASTMDYAHQLAVQGAPEGSCVWAQRQLAGRGRAGRTWVSPEGGMYLSLVLRSQRPVEEAPQIALLAGLAVAEAVQELTGLSPRIRWPNDVLLNDEKLAGILTEGRSSDQHGPHVIVGLGLNVTTPPDALPPGATSLARSTDRALDRIALAAELLRRLGSYYVRWHREGFGEIRPHLLPWIGIFGRFIDVTVGKRTVHGEAVDVDEAGRLVVRLESGVLQAFDAGEVTLLR